MKSNYKVQVYPFLLDPSPWPFLMSFAALFVTTGMVLVMHTYVNSKQLLIYGFFMVLLVMFLWLRDVVRESTLLAKQTSLIRSNLRIGFVLFIVSFFRIPNRTLTICDGQIICPADGKVVVIEETVDEEYFKGKRLQISVFMSPLNVHVNRNPISGDVVYNQYHKGKY